MAKKLYYKIGEACKELDIQPYVLRYWETEFPALSPSKSKSGQRVYSAEDLTLIGRIKKLLYDEGYTIAGAKKKLEKEAESRPRPVPVAPPDDEGSEDDAEAAPAAKKAPARKRAAGPKRAGKDPSTAEAARLRKGLEKALADARALLELLDS